MRPSCESAGTQRRCTAKISTASEATRNSGTDTTRIVAGPTIAVIERTARDRRVMPSTSASGTATNAVTPRKDQRIAQSRADQRRDRLAIDQRLAGIPGHEVPSQAR